MIVGNSSGSSVISVSLLIRATATVMLSASRVSAGGVTSSSGPTTTPFCWRNSPTFSAAVVSFCWVPSTEIVTSCSVRRTTDAPWVRRVGAVTIDTLLASSCSWRTSCDGLDHVVLTGLTCPSKSTTTGKARTTLTVRPSLILVDAAGVTRSSAPILMWFSRSTVATRFASVCVLTRSLPSTQIVTSGDCERNCGSANASAAAVSTASATRTSVRRGDRRGSSPRFGARCSFGAGCGLGRRRALGARSGVFGARSRLGVQRRFGGVTAGTGSVSVIACVCPDVTSRSSSSSSSSPGSKSTFGTGSHARRSAGTARAGDAYTIDRGRTGVGRTLPSGQSERGATSRYGSTRSSSAGSASTSGTGSHACSSAGAARAGDGWTERALFPPRRARCPGRCGTGRFAPVRCSGIGSALPVVGACRRPLAAFAVGGPGSSAQPSEAPPRRSTKRQILPFGRIGERGGGVGRRARRDLVVRLSRRRGDSRPHQRDEPGLVRTAPVRHGREVRRVGLDQEPLERRDRGGGADVVGVGERHDAAEGEVRAEIEGAARLVRAAGEAVEDGPLRHALVGQDAERRVPCIARVDDERAVETRGEADLGAERRFLVVGGAVQVVEVEAGLADANHSLGLHELLQLVPLVGESRRVMRVQAHGRAHREVPGGEVDGLAGGLEVGTHAHHPDDAGGACPLDHGVGIIHRLQMAVRVDPGHAERASAAPPKRAVQAAMSSSVSLRNRTSGTVNGDPGSSARSSSSALSGQRVGTPGATAASTVFDVAGMIGAASSANKRTRLTPVRWMTAARSVSLLTAFHGSARSQYALPVAQMARSSAVAFRNCLASSSEVYSSSRACTSAISVRSASPGSPPAGTVSPTLRLVKVRQRLTKLPKVSARSLLTAPAKPSHVKLLSSDSGAFAIRKYRQ